MWLEQLANRLKEPSSYSGLMGIALAIGLSNDQFIQISLALAGLFGFISFVLSEKGGQK